MTPHLSDSREQRAAEVAIVVALGAKLGVQLEPRRLVLGDGVVVDVDGATPDGKVLVEVYAHVGPLRGGQPKKLAADALKLSWLQRRTGAERLIIAVMDAETEAYLRRPHAWLTAAIAGLGIEVLLVDIDQLVRDEVVAAQGRQVR